MSIALRPGSHFLTARWLPFVLAIACFSLTAMFYERILVEQRRDQQALADATAESAASQIRQAMREPVGAFIHMARRLETAERLRQPEWEIDAQSYLVDVSGIVGLAVLDTDARIAGIVSAPGDRAVLENFTEAPGNREQLLKAGGDSHHPRLTPATSWQNGRIGLIVSAALQRDGSAAGFLIAALDVERVLKLVVAEAERRGYYLEVSGNDVVLAAPTQSWVPAQIPTAQSTVEIPGAGPWKIVVRGPMNTQAAFWADFNNTVLLAGLLISLLIPAGVSLAQAAWLRAREAEAVKKSLEQEVSERQRSEDALSENEERFRLAFDGAPIGMALVTRDGRWLRVNASMCRILGYSESELLQGNFQAVTHPDDLEADLHLARQVLSGEINSYHTDKRYFHKDGHIVHASLHVSFVRDKPGRPGYFVSQVQDISQRIEMDRIKREFISTVSHELRTPLTSIAGSLGLLSGGVAGELPPQAVRLVEIAERNSQRLVRLVDDILDIEKAAAGKLAFALEVQPLAPIVRQAIEANQEYAKGYGVKLELSQSAEDVAVRVERDRLIQVLTNLISNAAKYSPPGERVSLGIHRDGGHALVSVQDHGPGIAESFRDQIFQQFAQADNSDSRGKGGTGLGLCIAKAFIERLEGGIDYESVEGVGTTFFIRLPLYALPG